MTDDEKLEAIHQREQVNDVAYRVVQRVAELPDRSSPSDWPEAMLVTGEELIRIVVEEVGQDTHLAVIRHQEK